MIACKLDFMSLSYEDIVFIFIFLHLRAIHKTKISKEEKEEEARSQLWEPKLLADSGYVTPSRH